MDKLSRMHFLLTLTVVGLLCLGQQFAAGRGMVWRFCYLGFVGIVALRGIRSIALNTAANIAHPPRYDFLCFWLDGRVALLHHNVYAPKFFHLAGDALRQPADWAREFLDVGFLYPPTSIIWFAPLGAFKDPGSAVVAWYAFLFGILALVAIALWRQFFAHAGPSGLAIAFALLMAFPATSATLDCTQTVGIALLFALLFRGDRNLWRAGIWIALAFSIKPFLITLLIVPLVRRSWRTLASCGATIGALCAAALAIIGPAGFVTYLSDNPVSRVPGYMYSGMWNQSLLGWILRFAHREPARLAVTHELLYLAIAAVIATATIALCAYFARTDRDVAIALSLLLGLLVYPQTLYFYALLLVLPIAILWSRSGVSRVLGTSTALGTATIAALVGVSDGALTYLAIASTFALTVFVAFAPAMAQNAAASARGMFAGRNLQWERSRRLGTARQ